MKVRASFTNHDNVRNARQTPRERTSVELEFEITPFTAEVQKALADRGWLRVDELRWVVLEDPTARC